MDGQATGDRQDPDQPGLRGTDHNILRRLTGDPDLVLPGPIDVSPDPTDGPGPITSLIGRQAQAPLSTTPSPDSQAVTRPEPRLGPGGGPAPRREGARSSRSSASLPVSSFDTGHQVTLDDPRTHWAVWLACGIGAALIGQAAAWWFFHAAETFGGAMMFSLALLAGMIHPLFQRNAQEIWTRSLSADRANAFLARDLLVLFLGLILGYGLLPLAMGAESYASTFSGIARFVDARRIHLLSFDHGRVVDILANNLRVFLVFFLIGLLFRYVGTLIVVVYNAATWGVVFAAALSGSLDRGAGLAEAAVFLAAVTPHLMVETLAYLLAAMAGIFLSRGALRYRWTSERFLSVGAAVLRLAGLGAVLVATAAILESTWAHALVQWAFRHAQALGG